MLPRFTKNKWILWILPFFVCTLAFSQNNRIKTHSQIGWYNSFGTFKLSKKFSIHAEYQWRRDNYITAWQQSLLRVGLNYHAKEGLIFRLGYAWVETFAYGSIPINVLGRDFTEHRLYEMVQYSHKVKRIEFIHRFMVEQRLVGRYSDAGLTKEDQYHLLHRARYMIRCQFPLGANEIKNKTPYVALYDELFIGFGKNVIYNVFDQNRIGVLIGYQYNRALRLEAGYLNQTIQFGRQVNNQSILQSNNGFIINCYVWVDFSKQST